MDLMTVFLLERLAAEGEDEFFDRVPDFLIEEGYSLPKICRLMFDLGGYL